MCHVFLNMLFFCALGLGSWAWGADPTPAQGWIYQTRTNTQKQTNNTTHIYKCLYKNKSN